MVEKNIFIDFSIIKNSNPEKLKDELEVLVALKNNIFIWSKTVSPKIMKDYCKNIIFDLTDEKEKHLKIIKMRAEKKSYKEISDATGVPIKRLGFFLSTSPNKQWTLDDWIKDYYIKDSMIYSKVDFVIDPDPKFVNRFQIRADGNLVERID
jgi:hypothetical protein